MAGDDRIFLRGPREILTLDDLEKEVRRRANLDFFVVIDGPHLLSDPSCVSCGTGGSGRIPALLLRDLSESFEIPIICSAPWQVHGHSGAGLSRTGPFSEEAPDLTELAELVILLDTDKEGGDAGIIKTQYFRNRLGTSEGVRLLRFRPLTGEMEEADEGFRVVPCANDQTGARVRIGMV
jgi:hypothetical protein